MANILSFLLISCIVYYKIDNIYADNYCYNTDSNPYRYYTTKTKYTVIDRSIGHDVSGYGQVPGCEPTVFYLIARHGSRYLSRKKITLLSERLPHFQNHIANHQTQLCQEDKEAISYWRMRMFPQNDQIMVTEGWTELKEIAMRYKAIYPNLLDVPYNQNEMEFGHSYTSSNRTKDSAFAFTEGLFGSYKHVKTTEYPSKEDWLMRFYKLCEKYQKEIAQKPVLEKDKFAEGEEMQNIFRNIESRLGLPNGNFSIGDMEIIYDACTFEYAVYNDSPWCAVFTMQDLNVIEYFNDIRYYWNDMYGHELNYKTTCRLLGDTMKSLRMSSGDLSKKIITRFGHSGTLNSFFARLGLFHDDHPFTASGYISNKDRLLKTSTICPMASNIAFVLHECPNDDDNKISVFVNEQPVTLPIFGCSNGVCSFNALKREWQPIVNDCNLREMCDVQTVSNAAILSVEYALIITILYTLKLLFVYA